MLLLHCCVVVVYLFVGVGLRELVAMCCVLCIDVGR